MKPSLLILAAGMGSRYGGLKQMEEVGPNGEAIIDYSLYDAYRAGFRKVIFIIRDDFRDAFERFFEGKFPKDIEVHYVPQSLDDLPDGFTRPEARIKPWGTAHAVWAARNVINEPFAVINADDFYGKEAYEIIYRFLEGLDDNDAISYCTVSYYLKNTLSDHGTVNRGVCEVDTDNKLTLVTECKGIRRLESGEITYHTENGQVKSLPEDTLVSMNLWGFVPAVFEHTTRYFKDFLKKRAQEEKSELYIPDVITRMQEEGLASVDVLAAPSKWFGVTYREDKPHVVACINARIEEGEYPARLWKALRD